MFNVQPESHVSQPESHVSSGSTRSSGVSSSSSSSLSSYTSILGDVTGPRRSLSLKLSNTRVYEPDESASAPVGGRGPIGPWLRLEEAVSEARGVVRPTFFFSLLLSSPELSDAKVYEP